MIAIAPDFAARGIGVSLGVVETAIGAGPASPELARLLAEAMAGITDRLAGRRPQDLPAVAATRAAYKALGKDPARYRPAAEALLRRVAQGKGLAAVDTVVDINNLLSLETGFSIGTYDKATLTPPLVFRPGRAGETYDGIGRGRLNLEDLPVLADALGPFGSPTSDSERSKVTETTRAVSMVIIGFAPATVPETLLERARALFAAHGGVGAATLRRIEAG